MTLPIDSKARRLDESIERQRRLPLSEGVPLLTVIVPVLNEAATIDRLLSRVLAAPYAKQVIVVDDGSTDDTATMLQSWQTDPRVQVLRHGCLQSVHRVSTKKHTLSFNHQYDISRRQAVRQFAARHAVQAFWCIRWYWRWD